MPTDAGFPADEVPADGRWARMSDDGFVGLVGPIYEDLGARDVTCFRFVAEPKHRNRNGFVQGGMLMTFADRAMGAAARKHDENRVHVTAQLDIQFIRAAKIGTAVDIEARVVRETRNLSFVEATISSDGYVVAKASGIWSILQRGTIST